VKTISQKILLEDIVVDSSIQHPFGIQFKYCTFIKEEEEEEVKPNLSTMMQGKLHMVLDQKSNRKSERRRRRTEEVDS